jgi:two-component system response regulator YesN
MLKVMLVDDEFMTREGLREFVSWNQLGLEVAGEAEDGIEALERIETIRPDIVLCDVRMPRMDGIELASRIKTLLPDCKLIFLSGYSDTEYLKSAIKLNVVDYLEKPVQITELETLLTRVAQQIVESRQQQDLYVQIAEELDRSKPQLTAHLLRKLVDISSPEEVDGEAILMELKRIDEHFPVEGKVICCVFRMKPAGQWEDWHETVHGTAKAEGLHVLAAEWDGTGVVCAAVESVRHMDGLALWLNKLTGKAKGEHDRGVAAGVGEAVPNLFLLGISYRQAVQALQYKFYRGWNMSFWYRELAQPGRNKLLLFDKQQFIRYEEALMQQKMKEAIEVLDQTVNDLLLFPTMEVTAVRKKLFRWYAAMTKHYPEAMWEFEADELWSEVFVTGELYTIRNFMMRRLEIIQESLEPHKQGTEKSVIREIIRYVHDNYSNDVSISAIAGHVYLAPTYLCILFKKETGISMNDYITQFRVEQAKRLLGDRKYKLYEIANKIGYQDPNYFAKVFRKQTGVNPSEYREMMEKRTL